MSTVVARNLALEILARRDNSVAEMTLKLKRKNISEEDIADVIRWLIEKRLLNDEEFAQKKAESIFRSKLCGPRYIIQKLREARVAGELCVNVIESLGDKAMWQERAAKAIEQWQRVHPKHKDDKTRQSRFLASRGFDFYNN